jgi:DNA repair protein RecN (Recombination protein N)
MPMCLRFLRRRRPVLTCLRVRNFAIIDELEVELGPGMNVMTGETGAGKSILVEALKLVLGGKARPEVIRTGAEQAEVEALFDLADEPEIKQRLADSGIEVEDELVLRRVVQRNGRSRVYLNGALTSASQLGELARGLCDICSQHEHHTLADARTHLLLLDAFGKLEPQRAIAREAYVALEEAQTALDDLRSKLAGRAEREDLLRFQIHEIDVLALVPSGPGEPSEEDRLKQERDRQRHAGKLASTTAAAEDALYAGDDALTTRLGRIEHELQAAALLDCALSPCAEQLATLRAQLEDVGRELGSYARSVSLDEERLSQLEERLDAISKLKRKYGGSVEAILAHRKHAGVELAALISGEEHIEALEKALDTARSHAVEIARALSASRVKAATKLSKAVCKELSSLSMGDARVTVEVVQPAGQPGELCVDGAKLSATGIDRVEFMIAPNRGEEPQPLHRIASGGELSRAMLALKRVLAGLGPVGLYVFDEVDAGVGGAVAEVIGRKLKEVAEHHQVLCITHLPQIAVFANAHYYVSKSVQSGRTRSAIEKLGVTEQREEIARMLGGIQITSKTRAAASEMLRGAGRAN